VRVLFAGVDWAAAHHDVCVMGDDGTVLEQRRVSHRVAGIAHQPAVWSRQRQVNALRSACSREQARLFLLALNQSVPDSVP
jgi:hypothetical protein